MIEVEKEHLSALLAITAEITSETEQTNVKLSTSSFKFPIEDMNTDIIATGPEAQEIVAGPKIMHHDSTEEKEKPLEAESQEKQINEIEAIAHQASSVLGCKSPDSKVEIKESTENRLNLDLAEILPVEIPEQSRSFENEPNLNFILEKEVKLEGETVEALKLSDIPF